MPREAAVREARRLLDAVTPRPPARAVRRARLRVADVALFYGERSGGIRTYPAGGHAERAASRRCGRGPGHS